jgi:flagellar biosynthesis/type III secretory pathway M-ring protein FliF/YscJ
MNPEQISQDMTPWASRRKAIYLGVIVLTMTAIVFLIFWNFWYKAPIH